MNAHQSTDALLAAIETAIRRDPAQRGLIGKEAIYGPLCVGHLAGAARELAVRATHLVIVTGFFIPRGTPPAAETDGPPGALLLATVLQRLGIRVTLLTDLRCLGALRVAARASGFPAEHVVEYVSGDPDWRHAFLTTGPGRDLSHLLAIERVGPSHTEHSIAAEQGRGDAFLCDATSEFLQAVEPEHRNHCHNMRGEIIDEFTGDTHRLFEELSQFHPRARTMGIGDGANEIGMGAIPWSELRRRLSGEQAGWVPCRIPADWNIIAGTSNWGGYALAAAVAELRQCADVLRDLDSDQQFQLLEELVEHGPAVDGVTRRQEATVDGLPFLTYIQPWVAIRELLGLPG